MLVTLTLDVDPAATPKVRPVRIESLDTFAPAEAAAIVDWIHSVAPGRRVNRRGDIFLFDRSVLGADSDRPADHGDRIVAALERMDARLEGIDAKLGRIVGFGGR